MEPSSVFAFFHQMAVFDAVRVAVILMVPFIVGINSVTVQLLHRRRDDIKRQGPASTRVNILFITGLAMTTVSTAVSAYYRIGEEGLRASSIFALIGLAALSSGSFMLLRHFARGVPKEVLPPI